MTIDAVRIHGVMVTYRRPEELSTTLAALSRQSRPLDTLVVVDNDPAAGAAAIALAAGATHLATRDNIGPAGGLARGLAAVLDTAAESDWVLFLDDDDPPPSDDTISGLADIASVADPDVAATGLVGARYDRRTGQPVRVPDVALLEADGRIGIGTVAAGTLEIGTVEVDWIGGGQMAMYRVSAVREVGVPDESLFFGFDDLEYGLRLRDAGWRLVVAAAPWLADRTARARIGLDRSGVRSAHLAPAPWRRYYSARNLVLIASRHGNRIALPTAVLHELARAGRDLLGSATRPHGRSALRGVWHGARGVTGRQVDPDAAVSNAATKASTSGEFN